MKSIKWNFINSAIDEITSNGLINYWPINNDVIDYIGSSDLIPGSGVSLASDRFNNPNSSIRLNSGYYSLPSDVYFNGTFSFLAWVKPTAFTGNSRIIDCGNGQSSDNVIIMYTSGSGGRPAVQLFKGGASQPTLISSKITSINRWYHLAVVLDERNLTIYVNGSSVASLAYSRPNGVVRSSCFIGKSNWGDADASIYLDDIYIYDRDLSLYEILYKIYPFFLF